MLVKVMVPISPHYLAIGTLAMASACARRTSYSNISRESLNELLDLTETRFTDVLRPTVVLAAILPTSNARVMFVNAR
jgi:hypothetical protein